MTFIFAKGKFGYKEFERIVALSLNRFDGVFYRFVFSFTSYFS